MLGLLGRHREALKMAERGLEIDPADESLLKNRSAALEALGETDKARQPSRRRGPSADSPEMQGMAMARLEGAMRTGNIRELQDTLNQLLEDNVPNLEMLYELAQGHHPEAPAFQEILDMLAEDAVAEEPVRAPATSGAATEPLDPSPPGGSADESLELLRDGSPSQQIEARFALAFEFGRRGELEHAVELLERNVWAGVRTSAIFFDLARLYRALGQHELAAQATTDGRRIQAEELVALKPSTNRRHPNVAAPPASSAVAGHQPKAAVPAIDELAPLWRRTTALVIDLIVMVVMIGVSVTVVAVVYEDNPSYRMWHSVIDALIQLSIMTTYGTIFESSPIHATIGKVLAGIRVANRMGGSPNFGQVLGRNFVKALTGPKFLFWLFSIVSIWRDEERRAWHDRAAGTVVCRIRRD